MGDGKFHVQEVLTGLESGEFVEILAGISEGDEIVVSSQFLIDSEASIAGSIRRLESADRLPEQREMGAVFASGRVDEIDMAEKRIRVSHGPIDELAWPSMTMVFDVRPAVDLGQVKVGQDIRFALVQGQAGEYVMEQIFTGEKGAAESTGRQSGQPNEAEATSKSRSPSQAALRRITASAIVRGIDREGLVLNLQHEPITELKWPAMTMNFAVEEGAISDELGDGQTIHFSMYEDAEGKWVIDRIHIMKATGDGDDSDD
jgi:Cu(I)/Ag(I) efflux system membrane fusion protein